MKNSQWNIFGEIKEIVSVPSAAEYYGLAVRNGMTCCIFHDDRNPSMKLYDDHFYCFGCTEHGDVISLTAKLFSLTPLEAAKKLCSDFGISCNMDKPYIRQHIRIETQREKEQKVFRILSDYCSLLRRFQTEYAPKAYSETPHPLFTESLTKLEMYEHFCDIFITGTTDERKDFLENGKEIIAYADSRNRNCTAERELIAV